ncbi:MAG TPA: hydrogenase maturation nickel metallochaperone HypA [Chloroflexi bacterium]|nr:hydrogenase maturation nickel metallochaperone HypA [Chloroflexota bacterium]
MSDQLERMKAIVAQAIAEAECHHRGVRLATVHLIVYGETAEEALRRLFEKASRGSPAEGARLIIERATSRYICWNCCGLRFESGDGVCPNCGELALEVPPDISFALQRVEVAGAF